MSRPTDRYTPVPAPGELDTTRGQFWVDNPWQFSEAGHNLSAFEPNRVLLNHGDMTFLDVSFLSGADSESDSRGVLVGDITGDLQPDLIVRNAGGGPLQIYENRFPPMNRLVVSLRGTRSNRLGIGARIVAEIKGRQLTRELFPTDNFYAQQASQARFGLGHADTVSRLTIHWPSGYIQVLHDVPVNQHIRITEGSNQFDTIAQSSETRS